MMIDIQQEQEEEDIMASFLTMQFNEVDQSNQLLELDTNTQYNELENILLNDINLDELIFGSNNTNQTLSLNDDENLNLINFSLFDQFDHSFCDMPTPADESNMATTSLDSSINSSPPPSNFTIDIDETSTMSSFIEMKKSKKLVKRLNEKNCVEVSSNKLAAQKYRNKKLQMREKLFADCKHYEKLNKDLRKKIDDIQTEVNLIKTLLVQVYLAKK